MEDPKVLRQKAARAAADAFVAALVLPDFSDAAAMAAFEPYNLLHAELMKRASGEVNLEYNTNYETVEIEGVVFAYDVFKNLSILPLGKLVRLVSRRDGVLTLKVLDERSESEQLTQMRVRAEAAEAALSDLQNADDMTPIPDVGPTELLENIKRQLITARFIDESVQHDCLPDAVEMVLRKVA